MKTTFYTATTIDGFIADEKDGLDWLLTQPQDEGGPMSYDDFIKDVGAIVMGRTTYEWVRDHIEREGESWYYDMPAWVLTHADLPGIEGADVRFARGDVREVHAQMAEAAGGKDLWVVGGGDLAAQFAAAGLLDELVLSIAPVTLGAGRPLFTQPFDLRLVEHGVNGAFLCARYEVVGAR
ncbi:MAG TPA: dihydrofolate reductase family protein [Nocardioides sp.]|uniref:dihydrofolate reductase family protein n=1 Tax=Nocardioides sp. TaxID=35761 RepID=UPI002CA95D52|nr:dihydrofolate reductase family protein [Nocardioides sp.]HTW14330.1 dihydrofolate reductase family protein [Nocardioides sp.]